MVVIADHRHFRTSLAEVGEALGQVSAPVRVVGGLADDPKGADLLRGEWGGKLDKSLLIRTARDVAEGLVSRLPAAPSALQVPQPQPGGRHSAVLAPDAEPPADREPPPVSPPCPRPAGRPAATHRSATRDQPGR